MSNGLPSSRFVNLFDSLPIDAQHALVEKHLIPLLNVVDRRRSNRVLASASRLQKRHAGIPKLDLKAKRIEINTLLDEYHKDAKRACIKERSVKDEVVVEVVNSFTDWLSDIWSVVYEHHVDFWLAHKCLMFIASTLEHVESGRPGCKCAFLNMYLRIVLKQQSGKHVRAFEVNGAHNIEEVLLFIWRDLLLSLLGYGTQRQIAKIPEMLEEIEDLLGWTSLERVLYGGICSHDIDDEDDEDENSEWYDEEVSDFSDDNSEDIISPEIKSYYATHWSYRIVSQMWELRRRIQTAMTAVFKLRPSLRLYSALLAVSSDAESTETELKEYLDAFATSCSDMYAAALDIHALEGRTQAIVDLLRSHSHLLRPRDAPTLQTAVSVISNSPLHRPFALQIIEKELVDTARCIRAALLVSFSLLDDAANKEEIQKILKLRPSADGRQDRIERYVDAIATPGMNIPNPMAFAAMVMGLPLVPGMDPGEDADPLGYLDLDPHDPDLEDLREEFRPRFKQRFEGWVDTATLVKGGPAVLLKVYSPVVEMLPFLWASDVVDDILSRLADKPSKHHVCDGLDALSAFTKVQRRKILAKHDGSRRKHAARATQAGTSSAAAGTATPILVPQIPPLLPNSNGAGRGGIEDVD